MLQIRLLLIAACCCLPVAAILPTPVKPAPAKRTVQTRAVRAVKKKVLSPLASLPQLPSYLLPQPAPYRAPSQCKACADRLLLTAYSLLGIKYRLGGRNPAAGFDCSGLTKYVYEMNFPVSLPTSAPQQYSVGLKLSKDELQAGDLVFFRSRYHGWHVGMYVGEGNFIHAPRRYKTVSVAPLDSPYFKTAFVGARRILLSEPTAAGNN